MEAAAVQCTLGEILYAMDKIWGRHLPFPPSYQVCTSSSFAVADEEEAIKGEGRRGTMMATTMIKKKTKKRENKDPCNNPYQNSSWSTAVGRVSRW